MSKKLYEKTCRHCGNAITFYHGEKLDLCPECGAGDYIKPETETKLFLLQKKWIETRDKEVLGDMYLILIKYVRSKIKKILNGKVIYDEDKLDEKATDSVNLLIEYYLTKEDFCIRTSFMGYITHQINSVLYNKPTRFADSVESLNFIIDEGNKRELIDTIVVNPVYENSLNQDFVFSDQNENDLVKGIANILNDIQKTIITTHGNYYSILNLIGVYHYMKRVGDDFKYKYYDKFGRNSLKDFVEGSMSLVYKFIKDN